MTEQPALDMPFVHRVLNPVEPDQYLRRIATSGGFDGPYVVMKQVYTPGGPVWNMEKPCLEEHEVLLRSVHKQYEFVLESVPGQGEYHFIKVGQKRSDKAKKKQATV
jgi:hypothetical protein